MLNDLARQAVESATWGRAGTFRRPLYNTYGFARLPSTIEHLLTGDAQARAAALPPDCFGPAPPRCDTLVFFLIDGFGWKMFERFAPNLPFLRRFLEQGVVSKITSQFPSTTAAHMTTLHTGLPVGQSGAHEWYYYEPAVDAVIAPLLFSMLGDRERETLRSHGVRPADLYPSGTFYERLAARGIASSIFQHEDYARSTYSDHVFVGARISPYQTGAGPRDSVAGALTALAEELLVGHGPRYYFVYVASLDAHGHRYGLEAPEFVAQVETTFTELEAFFHRVAAKVPNALMMMSSDHGMTRVDPETTIYVNESIPDLPSYLKTGRNGELVRFGGSGRDLFLYARPERSDELQGKLTHLLEGRAEVWRTEELLAQGLFGPPPFDRLLPRVGDLVILPYAGESVFWREGERIAMHSKASHGGLTPEEMETALYLLPL